MARIVAKNVLDTKALVRETRAPVLRHSKVIASRRRGHCHHYVAIHCKNLVKIVQSNR